MSRESNRNKFKVSIIIPSYNRYPLNLNTLFALENQNFNLSKMEVIFIDDASTDDTPILKNYQPAYSFKYVQNKRQLGTSRTRNIGLNKTNGEIIIFLDAEMIVGPDYVNTHYSRHQNNKEQIVVIGRNRSKLYTYFFPNFNSRQIKEIVSLAKNSPFVKNRLCDRLHLQNITKTNLQALTIKITNPIQLIDNKEIKKMAKLKSFSKEKETDNLISRYITEHPDSSFNWRLCLGSNHSFKRTLLDKVGGYDENFKGWGLEDKEFAFRLYKAGANFVIDPHLYRYHQEHPVNPNKKSEISRNRMLFKQRHPDIDMRISTLSKITANNLSLIDRILQEHRALNTKFPGRFEDFNSAIVLLLQQMDQLNLKKEPVSNLLTSSGINNDPKRKNRIYSERNTIESLGKYKKLVRLFDILTEK